MWGRPIFTHGPLKVYRELVGRPLLFADDRTLPMTVSVRFFGLTLAVGDHAETIPGAPGQGAANHRPFDMRLVSSRNRGDKNGGTRRRRPVRDTETARDGNGQAARANASQFVGFDFRCRRRFAK